MISVAIPTVGRDSLRATLRSLERQTVPPDEVLVINQGDPNIQLEFSLPLRVLHQDARGLSRARNRALDEFRGEYVLWTDDDQEVAPDWVEQLGNLARAFPEASFFGGSVYPPLDYDPSTTYMDQLYVIGDVRIEASTFLRPAVQHPYIQNDIFGGNFALSRRLVESVGRYDELLGRGSGAFEKGEDTDFNMRAIAQGHWGVLSARLIIYHTFGARPIAPVQVEEAIELAAVLEWKGRHIGGSASELSARLRPYGRKKALVGRYTGGAMFSDHAARKALFDKTLDRLDREMTVVDGCLHRK